MRKRPLIILLLILSLTYRFWYFSTHLVFGNDITRDFVIVQEARNTGSFLIGLGPKTSIGNFHVPPFYYYLSLFFSFFTNNHPLTMPVATTFLESFTVIIVFLILQKFIKKKYAFFAALTYIFAPLAVIFGTKAWNPDLIPLFSSVALYCWLLYLIDKKPKAIPIGVVSTLITIYLHLQSVVLLPFVFLVFLFTVIKDRKNTKYWLIGFLISIVTLLPYLIFETNSNWKNTTSLFNYLTNEHSQYYDRVSKVSYIIKFIPSFLERVFIGSETKYWILGRLLLLTGFLHLVFETIKEFTHSKINKKHFILLVYFLFIFAMMRVFKGDKLDYYMSILFILPSLFLGLLSKYLKSATIILSLILISLAIIFNSRAEHFNEFADLNRAISFIKTQTMGKDTRFIFHDPSLINSFSYYLDKDEDIKINQLSNQTIEIYDRGQARIWSNFSSRDVIEDGRDPNALAIDTIKYRYSYEQTSKIQKFHRYEIVSGNLLNTTMKPEKIDLVIDLDYGTDILMLELFQ